MFLLKNPLLLFKAEVTHIQTKNTCKIIRATKVFIMLTNTIHYQCFLFILTDN